MIMPFSEFSLKLIIFEEFSQTSVYCRLQWKVIMANNSRAQNVIHLSWSIMSLYSEHRINSVYNGQISLVLTFGASFDKISSDINKFYFFEFPNFLGVSKPPKQI